MTRVLPGDWQARRDFLGVDAPPAHPDPMDDEFLGGSLDTNKWTWIDQGDILAYQPYQAGGLLMTLRESTNRMRGIYQSTPVGNWEFTARIAGPVSDSANAFIFAGESPAAEQLTVGFWLTNVMRGISYATPSSSAGSWGQEANTAPRMCYARVRWDGTDLVAEYSFDGYGWFAVNSDTTGYAPAIVGLGISNQSGQFATYRFFWFRRTG